MKAIPFGESGFAGSFPQGGEPGVSSISPIKLSLQFSFFRTVGHARRLGPLAVADDKDRADDDAGIISDQPPE